MKWVAAQLEKKTQLNEIVKRKITNLGQPMFDGTYPVNDYSEGPGEPARSCSLVRALAVHTLTQTHTHGTGSDQPIGYMCFSTFVNDFKQIKK